MRRLRSLSEAECYARCYGVSDATVHVLRLEPRRPRQVLIAEGEALRRRFEEYLDARDPAVSPSPSSLTPDSGRARPEPAGAVLRHQPRTRVSAAAGGPLREPPQRFLAAPVHRRVHAAAIRACGTVRAAETTASAVTMPQPERRRARATCAAATSRARPSGCSGSRRSSSPCGSASSARRRTAARSVNARAGVQERRLANAALRPSLDVAGERGGAVGSSAKAGSGSSRRARRRLAAPAVRDRRAAVAAERLRAQLHAGRGLAALVLGPVDQRHARARRRPRRTVA